ncbi:FkbM family methyltransferase [Oxalobacteraceae bacterium CAVE-383]|nr:FkbM family methyltransferase [Oxalobacteraceae bacterium CAVE-383]
MNLVKLDDDLEVFHKNSGETRALYQEIFVDRCYERAGQNLKSGDVVFDVGANIGFATLYLHRVCTGLRFFCFEPLPTVSNILRANLEKFNIDALVIEAAASDAAGLASLTYYPNNTVMSGLHSNPAVDREVTRCYLINSGFDEESIAYFLEKKFQTATVECETLCLSDVIEQRGIDRIDLLKIDVEKNERQVLAGITPNHWPRIRCLCVEVHDIDDGLSAVLDLLKQRGFMVEVFQNFLLKDTGLYDVLATRR